MPRRLQSRSGALAKDGSRIKTFANFWNHFTEFNPQIQETEFEVRSAVLAGRTRHRTPVRLRAALWRLTKQKNFQFLLRNRGWGRENKRWENFSVLWLLLTQKRGAASWRDFRRQIVIGQKLSYHTRPALYCWELNSGCYKLSQDYGKLDLPKRSSC